MIARRIAALALLGVLVVSGLGWPGAAGARSAQGDERPPARKVLIVTIPRLTWATIEEERPPALVGLFARSTVASLSVRTVGSDTGLAEGYATLGAGNRAVAEPVEGGLALAPDEPFEGGDAAAAFTRRTGTPADGAVLHLAATALAEDNDEQLYDTEPGALADALAAAGHDTAVVGNADTLGDGGRVLHREAALAVMDGDGLVDHGEVRPSALLAPEPSWPFGVRLDPAGVQTALAQSWAASTVTVLDLSDLERAEAYTRVATGDAGDVAFRRALRTSDRLLADALELVDLTTDMVVVVSPVAPNGPDQLTVFAMAGTGIEPGLATSGSTRRSGYVTLTDVAPTVLRRLHVERPNSMTGAPIRSNGAGAPDAATFAALREANEAARFRDTSTQPASITFIVFECVAVALSLLVLLGWQRSVAPLARALLLVALAVPSAVFLAGTVDGHDVATPVFLGGVYALAALLAGLAWLVGRAVGDRLGPAAPFAPPLLLVGFGFTLLVVDVMAGGRLQIDTAFGYSAIVAGRFAGYGNQAFALVAISAVVLGAGVWTVGALRDHRPPGRGVLAVTCAVFAIAILADGHPSFGSDVGGVLATVPAYALVVLVLAGARLEWRRVVGTIGATAVILGVFAALDLARPPEDRTHLGRLVSRTVEGGAGDFFTVIGRKLQANISSFGSSWITMVIVAAVVLGVLVHGGALERLQGRVPGMRACLVGGAAAAVLGFAVNDSGIAVPGMMLAVLIPYVLWLLLAGVDAAAPLDGEAGAGG